MYKEDTNRSEGISKKNSRQRFKICKIQRKTGDERNNKQQVMKELKGKTKPGRSSRQRKKIEIMKICVAKD